MAKHPEKYKNYADNILFYISPHLIRQYFQGILHEVFMRLQLCFAYFTIVASPIREYGHINQFTGICYLDIMSCKKIVKVSISRSIAPQME